MEVRKVCPSCYGIKYVNDFGTAQEPDEYELIHNVCPRCNGKGYIDELNNGVKVNE